MLWINEAFARSGRRRPRRSESEVAPAGGGQGKAISYNTHINDIKPHLSRPEPSSPSQPEPEQTWSSECPLTGRPAPALRAGTGVAVMNGVTNPLSFTVHNEQ